MKVMNAKTEADIVKALIEFNFKDEEINKLAKI